MNQIGTLIFCEGATDALAMVGIGFEYVVGRSSALTEIERCAKIADRLCPVNSVVIADGDPVGLEGATRLADKIGAKLLIFPDGIKDARSFIQGGGTKEQLMALL
jgi:hypothetical protein